MPANVTSEFNKAWEKAKSATDPEERLKYLYEALALCPKHKGTEKLLALIKREIAQTRRELERKKEEEKKRGRRGIAKEGDILVILLGGPNAGKSYLINKLTNAKLESTEIPYETQEPVSVILNYKGAKIQLVEYPSYYPREHSYLVKNADLLILFDDSAREFLRKINVKLGKKEKKLEIIKEPSGGIRVIGSLNVDKQTLAEILRNYGIHNATVKVYEDSTLEDLIDYLEGLEKKPYIDLTKEKINLEELPELIIRRAGKILVFTKETEEGLVLDEGSTVRDLVLRIHKDLLRRFKFAKVWGRSAKFPGQRVGLDHKLEHLDRVIIYTK